MHEICLKLFIHRYNTEIIADCWLDTTSKITTTTLSFLRKTKDRNSSTSSTGIFLHSTGSSVSSRGGRSFACSFNQALDVRARDPKRPFNPAHTGSFLINVYNEFFLFFRRAFFSLFNEIFALTSATAVYFSLDNHN